MNAALAVATGDFAIIQDADLECSPEEIPLLLKALKPLDPRAKVAVIGSRETHAKNPKKKTLSRFGSLSITKLINLFYGSALTDASMCYKLFPKSAFGYFDAGGFEAELLFILRLLQNGYRIVEVPVSYIPRSTRNGKKIRYRDGIKILLRIVIFRVLHITSYHS
ncbi:MAG: glycosyltransferase [Parcubacteria group bacterium]|nr:glycosyltransferase [Parcubacteria group bacterium]